MADIRVRVGQQNAIKVVSSLTGSTIGIPTYAYRAGIADYANIAGIATNVVGGVARVSQLNVSGISTFVGIATFQSGLYYQSPNYNGPNGVGYFNNSGLLVSSASTLSSSDETYFTFTTNSSGVPIWSNSIDGGIY